MDVEGTCSSRLRGASPWRSSGAGGRGRGRPRACLPPPIRGAEELVYLLAHALNEMIYPLVLAVGRPIEELCPVGGMLYFLMSDEGPGVMGDFSAVQRDLDIVGVGEDSRRASGASVGTE